MISAFFLGKRKKKNCVQKGTLRCRLLPKGVRGTGGPPRGARRVKNVNLSFARKGGREIYVFDTLSWKRNTAYQLQASVQGSQSCRGVRGREVPATENVAFKVGRRRIAARFAGRSVARIVFLTQRFFVISAFFLAKMWSMCYITCEMYNAAYQSEKGCMVLLWIR